MTKNWDKGYNELLYMTNLPSLADRRLYLKLCSMYKIVHNLSHQILLYLKSPDRIPAHLLPCTTLLHILCFIFLTLLYLMLYHNGTHFQSQLFQLPPLQLFNTHLQCITLSNYIQGTINISYAILYPGLRRIIIKVKQSHGRVMQSNVE